MRDGAQSRRPPVLTAWVRGVGLLGPGLSDWASGAPVLAGDAPYQPSATVLPVPQALPPAERRRTGATVKLAIGVAQQAVAAAAIDPAQLTAVFASSGGDGSICHEICETLATDDRQISPTRFHNSVHNAAAGYWSIATGATAACSAICAYDASFAAGLLEALTQIAVSGAPVLLVAYETPYPEPLHAKRPLPDAFGVALVLTPAAEAASLRAHRCSARGRPGRSPGGLAARSAARRYPRRTQPAAAAAARAPRARAGGARLPAGAMPRGGGRRVSLGATPFNRGPAGGEPLDRRWIAAHIPHQGPMCLLEEVLTWDAARVRCRATSHRLASNPLRAGGRLGAVCGVEYAGQAMAVHGAIVAAMSGQRAAARLSRQPAQPRAPGRSPR